MEDIGNKIWDKVHGVEQRLYGVAEPRIEAWLERDHPHESQTFRISIAMPPLDTLMEDVTDALEDKVIWRMRTV